DGLCSLRYPSTSIVCRAPLHYQAGIGAFGDTIERLILMAVDSSAVSPVDPAPSPDGGGEGGGGWTVRLILGLAAIILLLEVFSISYMMVSTALPDIAVHFGTNQVAWTVTAFALTGA